MSANKRTTGKSRWALPGPGGGPGAGTGRGDEGEPVSAGMLALYQDAIAAALGLERLAGTRDSRRMNGAMAAASEVCALLALALHTAGSSFVVTAACARASRGITAVIFWLNLARIRGWASHDLVFQLVERYERLRGRLVSASSSPREFSIGTQVVPGQQRANSKEYKHELDSPTANRKFRRRRGALS